MAVALHCIILWIKALSVNTNTINVWINVVALSSGLIRLKKSYELINVMIYG
jgi:hypothetical protein